MDRVGPGRPHALKGPLDSHPTGADLQRLFAITGAPAAELEAIIQSMPDAIYIGGAAGITKANRLALEMLGFTNVEELNQNITTLAEKIQTRHHTTGERIRPQDEPFARAMAGETVVEEVVVKHLKTGNDVIIRCAASPITFDGEVVGAVAINTDITRQVLLRRRLEETNRHLKQALDTLETFNYVVTHDLKEPVRAMGVHLEDAHELAESAAMESVNKAREAHGRLSRQMRGLLEFSRSSIEPLTLQPIMVSDAVRGEMCLAYYEHLLRQKGARLEVDDTGTPVMGTELLLSQALGNIILNALRHSNKKVPLIRVIVRPQQDGTTVEVAVEDNGPGFSDAVIERLMGTKSERPRTIRGGFGLTITKHAVERLGGTMSLAVAPSGGARVVMRFPENVHGDEPAAHLRS